LNSAPESLKLHFDPPARLDQVIVTGPQGSMPMMVEAVGEVADYDLPLSGMSPGAYTVEWKAISRGKDYSGQFRFKVAPRSDR
jgi:methionine-rich copper-binding protein CopC